MNPSPWAHTPSAFSDLAPTLPPEAIALQLDGETRPGLPPGKRSAIPIVAGAITVLAIAGAGLAYAMLRGGSDPPAAPATLDPAAGSAHVAAPAPQAAPNPQPTPNTQPAPTPHPVPNPQTAPATPTAVPDLATTNNKRDKPARPGHKVAPDARTGRTATKPTSPIETSSGPVTKPDSGDSDKPSGAVRDIRQVDPPKPGDHTAAGSPIETTIEIGKKPPKPAAPEAPKNGLPSPEPPKDPSPP